MNTDSDQPTRAELVAWAWRLSTGNDDACTDGKPLSTRQASRVMGVSQSTAARMIREARFHDVWMDLHDQHEARQALAVGHMKLLARLEGAMEEEPDKLGTYAPIWFRGAGQLAQLLGANAPVRVQTEDVTPNGRYRPDPELAAEIKLAQEEARARRARDRGIGTTDTNGEQ